MPELEVGWTYGDVRTGCIITSTTERFCSIQIDDAVIKYKFELVEKINDFFIYFVTTGEAWEEGEILTSQGSRGVHIPPEKGDVRIKLEIMGRLREK